MKKIIVTVLLFCSAALLIGNDAAHKEISDIDVKNVNREDMAALIEQEKLSVKDIFDGIYYTNFWCCSESISGGGSTLASTAVLRSMLPRLLKAFNITTLIDAPCGDFNWMQKVDLEHTYYIGVDIVDALIRKNKAMYGNTHRVFLCLDITADLLPQGEMILCRDCFQHLSYEKVFQALRLFKASGAIYLLTTTYRTTSENHDIHTGETCLYNLELPPFNFPTPIRFIEEKDRSKNRVKEDAKKGLGLWKLDTLIA